MPDDLAIARLASRQHGNVTREQLLVLGFNSAAISYRVKTGRLHRGHRGVYAVGRPPKTALERASAAVLACGPGAALSHRSALALWGLADWRFGLEVSAACDRRPQGIKIHLCVDLGARNFRRHDDIRVTSPARTLLDCAPRLTQRALARAANEALRRKLVRRSDLADVIERFPRHPEARRLARFADATGGPTRSGWEDDFPAFCRAPPCRSR